VDARTSELPDHAGLELGFLQRLAEAEMSSWAHGDDDQSHYWQSLQAGFFEHHVARWIPDLCVEVKASSDLPYFVGFADWIASALEEIRRSGFVPPGSNLEGFTHADSSA
jgi:TorA maturation chaperone TorD